MNKRTMFISTGVASLLIASSITAPVFAWHPKGTIQKTVQNVTAGTAASDANDAATAVIAKAGDTLTYTITVNNIAAPADLGYNDMARVSLIDTLPAGVEQVGKPSLRVIAENMGTILPGKSVTKTYSVKVTSTAKDALITNKACFNGNSLVNDNFQTGCDVAVVKVTVPEAPVTTPDTTIPTPTPTAPQAQVAAAQTTKLPNVGAGSFIIPAALLTALAGYFVRLRSLERA